MSPIVKRKGEKFTLPGKYLLFILTILCTGMVLLTFNTTVFSGPLSSVAGYTVVPFAEGISSVGSWLAGRSEELAQIRDLIAENENLKEQVDELTIENTRLQQDRYELTNLRSFTAWTPSMMNMRRPARASLPEIPATGSTPS